MVLTCSSLVLHYTHIHTAKINTNKIQSHMTSYCHMKNSTSCTQVLVHCLVNFLVKLCFGHNLQSIIYSTKDKNVQLLHRSLEDYSTNGGEHKLYTCMTIYGYIIVYSLDPPFIIQTARHFGHIQ